MATDWAKHGGRWSVPSHGWISFGYGRNDANDRVLFTKFFPGFTNKLLEIHPKSSAFIFKCAIHVYRHTHRSNHLQPAGVFFMDHCGEFL